MDLRVVMEIGDGVHKRNVDTEEFHDNDADGVEQFLKFRIGYIERQMEGGEPGARTNSSPTTLLGKANGDLASNIKRLKH